MTPIALAFASLVAAVALWVAVTETENPTMDEQLPFSIPVEPIGVTTGLAVYSLSPDAVVVTARATEETLEDLTASNFRATVNLTGIRDTQTTQTVVVEVVGIDDDEVDIVEVSSLFTRVVLETEVEKTIPVQVNRLGSLAQGFTIASTELDPEQVTVIGPSTSVGLVEQAVADVNLTGIRSDFEQEVELSARDAGGAIQPLVSLDPSTVDVRMNIEQLETPQIVPVQVELQGEVARGFNIVDIEINPQTVLVAGSLEILQSVNSLQTEPVDVSGATTSLTRSVALELPDGVQTQRPNVNVIVQIEPATGSRAITVAPAVINVPDGLSPVIQTSFLTVRVSGPVPVLNELTAADIQATVDATGLTEGQHTLGVEISVPTGITLESVEPQQAVIALRP